jgi:hypothetical protein
MLLALLAAVALAGWGTPPRRLHAQAPDAQSVVQAYTAAWNAHDLPAVLVRFAPDAVVRERSGAVPAAVWDTRDPQVVRTYLDGAHEGLGYDTGNLVWMTGHQEIAMWAVEHFARHHRFAAGPPRAAGDTVVWPYREYTDPYQLVPGFSPTEGNAEAVVRGGRITTLTLVVSPESVQRRRDEAQSARARAVAPRLAAPIAGGPSLQPRGPQRGGHAADQTGAAWPLALGGLALLGVVTAKLSRRRPSPPAQSKVP